MVEIRNNKIFVEKIGELEDNQVEELAHLLLRKYEFLVGIRSAIQYYSLPEEELLQNLENGDLDFSLSPDLRLDLRAFEESFSPEKELKYGNNEISDIIKENYPGADSIQFDPEYSSCFFYGELDDLKDLYRWILKTHIRPYLKRMAEKYGIPIEV